MSIQLYNVSQTLNSPASVHLQEVDNGVWEGEEEYNVHEEVQHYMGMDTDALEAGVVVVVLLRTLPLEALVMDRQSHGVILWKLEHRIDSHSWVPSCYHPCCGC